MSDPFARLLELRDDRDRHEWQFRTEIAALRAAGFSLRAIASAAGLAPDTIMRWTR
jgi:lambda repressor-like predicted transcriptional regulator